MITGLFIVLVMVMTCANGCKVNMEQLPFLDASYVSKVEFLKEVRNHNGKARKKYFTRDRVTSPFYFFLKIKEIEDKGTLSVVFYENPSTRTKEMEKRRKVVAKDFSFGEVGKYYEYILFFDRVEVLTPGVYRYAVFLNRHLIYEGPLQVNGLSTSTRHPGTVRSNVPIL